ncbi:RNA polymerase sigma factor SigZ [Paenibacillus arenilitoris]|uniref:RNA polymerase sigma factor n=1 Tax=Paenibacillus arenilitoris TaxID=2772299 RepID=A0A927H599_9BACL|nr:RNA polymerase sigma factor SigZ [Paenibacillus arenilitoris]MBD2867334.1 RNA polymerase sigma factor SigZ [Paenibacillus arenilitoris]
MELESLWADYHKPISRFVHKKTNRHPDADDIVQNVFLKAFDHLADVKDESKIRAWLYRIARNCIADHYRKEQRTEELPADHAQTPQEAQPSDYAGEALAGLKSVLPLLPDKYREAVELAELAGMSQKQVSERLAISYSGAKSRVQRAREMIKELMTSCCQIEADRYGNIVDYEIVLDQPRRRKYTPK